MKLFSGRAAENPLYFHAELETPQVKKREMSAVIKKLRNIVKPSKNSAKAWNDFYLSRVYLTDEGSAKNIFNQVQNETKIGPSGVLANIDAVDYITRHKIPGAIVECGVWRGGSVMAMQLRLLEHGDTGRDCFLFDTYAGMTEPTEHDVKLGEHAGKKFEASQKDTHNEWCYASLEDVQSNIGRTGYPSNKCHFIKGDILKTIHETDISEIALLRLDTDWYESTQAEMEFLYPKVVKGGVVILDDYGVWDGARRAVDEYFAKHGPAPLMGRIDQTRRFFVKP